jgi:hypothetical protein
MLTRSKRWYAPAGKVLTALAGAMLLALLFTVTDGGRTAEAAGTEPVSMQSDVQEDLCGGYLIDGRWVHQHPCNPPVINNCWNWGCGGGCNWGGCGGNCYFAGCVNTCNWCGYQNCGYAGVCGGGCGWGGCVNACGYGYGCGNSCYNTCGVASCGVYSSYYGYNFVNYACRTAPAFSMRFENPPNAVFCGSTTNLTVATQGIAHGADIRFNTSLGTITQVADVINGRAVASLNLPFGRTGLAQVTASYDGISTSTILQVVC